ncbi:MAG: hypothetical protein J6L69_06770 [Lachnospiraceae bacterium]|nr:hypothetical protein [Lachnospiraceae bacterium]
MVIHTKQKMKVHKVENTIKPINTLKGKRKWKFGRIKENFSESRKSIKAKHKNLKMVGAAGINCALDKVDGGDELRDATVMAYAFSKPITGISSKGAAMFKNKFVKMKGNGIKKVNTAKKIGKKSVKNVANKTAKKVAKETAKTSAKETAKATAKATVKVATTVATTAAGTTVAPGIGTAIGIGAGYVAGVAIDEKDTQITCKSRMLKFFLDKLNEQSKQKDSFAKLVKDLFITGGSFILKTIGPVIALSLLTLIPMIIISVLPIVIIVAIIYNSPLAIFFPPLQDGDTVQTVTSAYVAEFNRDVNTLADEHEGYDIGKIVYVGYDEGDTPSNYYDILNIYMVKYGVEDVAIIVNDTARTRLQDIVNDMCSYTTSTGTETVRGANGRNERKSVLYVNVTLKTYEDMADEYNFNSNQKELLESMVSQESINLLTGS